MTYIFSIVSIVVAAAIIFYLKRYPRFAGAVVSTCGVIVFSQGLSFAMWSRFSSEQYMVDLHAFLLAGGGFGLLCAGLVIDRLEKRLDQIEEKLTSKSNT